MPGRRELPIDFLGLLEYSCNLPTHSGHTSLWSLSLTTAHLPEPADGLLGFVGREPRKPEIPTRLPKIDRILKEPKHVSICGEQFVNEPENLVTIDNAGFWVDNERTNDLRVEWTTGGSRYPPRYGVDWQNLSAADFCGMTTEQQRILANALSERKAYIKYDTGRKSLSRGFADTMTLDAVVGMCMAEDVNPDGLSELLFLRPTSAGAQLSVHAATVFTRERVAVLLKALITNANVAGHNAVQRQQARDQLSVIGSAAIACYLSNQMHNHSKSSAHEDGIVQGVAEYIGQRPDVPNAIKELVMEAASRQGALENDFFVIFASAVVDLSPTRALNQALTDFISCMIAGGLRYAHCSKSKSGHAIDRTATVLAFAFALGGFVPVAGAGAGIVGLAVDKMLHATWKTKDASGFLEHLEASITSVLKARLKDCAGVDRSIAFASDLQDIVGIAKSITWGDADYPWYLRSPLPFLRPHKS